MALLPSRASSPPHFIRVVVEVEASEPPHVLKLWWGKQGHALCKTLLIGVSKGMLPVRYFCSNKASYVSVEFH